MTNVAKERERAARLSREKWRWLDILDVGALVDVCAITRQFARGLLQQRPGILVSWSELLEDCFRELHHQFQRELDGVAGYAGFNVAIADSDGELNCYSSDVSASFSLLHVGQAHEELFPFTSEITSEPLTVRRLDSIPCWCTVTHSSSVSSRWSDADPSHLPMRSCPWPARLKVARCNCYCR